jgi:SAM-dependent methyltransferase
MNTPKNIFGQISGGRVLDVATGGGNFIHFLLEGLKDYTEIIGIDANPRGEAAFAEAFKGKTNIRFELMDALQPTFKAESFDMVCISNSLHHFADPLAVLLQMERLARPGGYLVVAEMYRDRQTETQMTHVLLHHWWAAVDRAKGVVHNETYLRDEIAQIVENLGLVGLATYDLADLCENPLNPEILAELNTTIDRTIQRAEGDSDLQRRGEELRKRVAEIGFHSATSLVLIGRKQHNTGLED